MSGSLQSAKEAGIGGREKGLAGPRQVTAHIRQDGYQTGVSGDAENLEPHTLLVGM